MAEIPQKSPTNHGFEEFAAARSVGKTSFNATAAVSLEPLNN